MLCCWNISFRSRAPKVQGLFSGNRKNPLWISDYAGFEARGKALSNFFAADELKNWIHWFIHIYKKTQYREFCTIAVAAASGTFSMLCLQPQVFLVVYDVLGSRLIMFIDGIPGGTFERAPRFAASVSNGQLRSTLNASIPRNHNSPGFQKLYVCLASQRWPVDWRFQMLFLQDIERRRAPRSQTRSSESSSHRFVLFVDLLFGQIWQLFLWSKNCNDHSHYSARNSRRQSAWLTLCWSSKHR